MSRETAIARAEAYFDEGRFQADLAALVAFETESQDPAKRCELGRYLNEAMRPRLEEMGLICTLHDNPDPDGGPLLVGERIENPDLETVLTYGHGDVIRAQTERWREALHPFRLVEEGDRLYGRGTADNKIQHLIDIAALEAVLAARGRLGFNVKIEKDAATLEAAWDGGVRYYDTSPWYGRGQSEHRLGRSLYRRPREDFVISSKVGRVFRAPASAEHFARERQKHGWTGGLQFAHVFDYSYDGIMRSYEDSQQRLGMTRIDLLIIHDLDLSNHGSQAQLRAHMAQLATGGFRALEELKQAGAIGAGVNDLGTILPFLELFDLDFFLVALRYTLAEQDVLDAEFPACAERCVGIVVGGVFNSGILATGPRPGARYNYREPTGAERKRIGRIEAVCDSFDVPLPVAALQFPLHHPLVASVIPGAFRPEHVTRNIASMRHDVPDALWQALKNEAPYPRGRARAGRGSLSVLRVVDPHFHVWDLATGLYPHFEPKPGADVTAPTSRSYLFDEYLGEGGTEVEILKVVFVEAIPTEPLGEARHVQALADGSRIPIGLVARTDLSAPEAAERIAELALLPALRGIRQILNRHNDPELNYVDVDYMADPRWQGGLDALKAHSLGFDLQIYPRQMGRAADIAGAHLDIPFVLNHAGMWADRTLAGWREWRAGIRRLAERDNVAVKISGLAMLDPEWTLNSIRPLVYDVLDAFGTGRAMFASNFPVDKSGTSFAQLWQSFDKVTADLSEDERAALFRGNAERIYRM